MNTEHWITITIISLQLHVHKIKITITSLKLHEHWITITIISLKLHKHWITITIISFNYLIQSKGEKKTFVMGFDSEIFATLPPKKEENAHLPSLPPLLLASPLKNLVFCFSFPYLNSSVGTRPQSYNIRTLTNSPNNKFKKMLWMLVLMDLVAVDVAVESYKNRKLTTPPTPSFMDVVVADVAVESFKKSSIDDPPPSPPIQKTVMNGRSCCWCWCMMFMNHKGSHIQISKLSNNGPPKFGLERINDPFSRHLQTWKK